MKVLFGPGSDAARSIANYLLVVLSKQFAQQMKMYLLSNIFISESNVLHNDKVSTWVICLDAADVKKKKRRRKELRFCLGPEWGRLVSSLAYSCSAEQIICSADENAFAKHLVKLL